MQEYYCGPNVILIHDQVLQSFISRRAYKGGEVEANKLSSCLVDYK